MDANTQTVKPAGAFVTSDPGNVATRTATLSRWWFLLLTRVADFGIDDLLARTWCMLFTAWLRMLGAEDLGFQLGCL